MEGIVNLMMQTGRRGGNKGESWALTHLHAPKQALLAGATPAKWGTLIGSKDYVDNTIIILLILLHVTPDYEVLIHRRDVQIPPV